LYISLCVMAECQGWSCVAPGKPWLILGPTPFRLSSASPFHQCRRPTPHQIQVARCPAGWLQGVGRPRPIVPPGRSSWAPYAGLRASPGALRGEQAVGPGIPSGNFRRIVPAIANPPGFEMPLPHTVLAQTLGDPVQLQPGLESGRSTRQPSPPWCSCHHTAHTGSSIHCRKSLEPSGFPHPHHSNSDSIFSPCLARSLVGRFGARRKWGDQVVRDARPHLPHRPFRQQRGPSAPMVAAASLSFAPPGAVARRFQRHPPAPESVVLAGVEGTRRKPSVAIEAKTEDIGTWREGGHFHCEYLTGFMMAGVRSTLCQFHPVPPRSSSSKPRASTAIPRA